MGKAESFWSSRIGMRAIERIFRHLVGKESLDVFQMYNRRPTQ